MRAGRVSPAPIKTVFIIFCTFNFREPESKKAARRVARILQKLGFRTKFTNFRVVNVLGTSAFPFGVKPNEFTQANRANARCVS